MNKKLFFHITPLIITLTTHIYRELGFIRGAKLYFPSEKICNQNVIKKIHATLVIEGNRLSEEQVSDIFDKKMVFAPLKDIYEARNAIETYSMLAQLNPVSAVDLKKAHGILMKALVEHHGMWRKGGVMVVKGAEIIYTAPPAKMVPELMDQLFGYIKKDTETPWLIKACIFHYELERIHPFSDGNGRMGRLWQQLLSMQEDSIFEILPVESIIRENQERYYDVLAACDKAADSTLFVEFSLECILKALHVFTQSAVAPVQDYQSRLSLYQSETESKKKSWFSRKEYILFHKDISSATASRDLLQGVQEGMLEKQGDKSQAEYRFIT